MGPMSIFVAVEINRQEAYPAFTASNEHLIDMLCQEMMVFGEHGSDPNDFTAAVALSKAAAYRKELLERLQRSRAG